MGFDKALLAYRESCFLNRLIDLFLPRVSPVLVVLGHHAGTIRPAVALRPGLEIVVNRNYRAGQLSSLQTAIRALPPEAGGALLTLVDHPAVAPATIDAMLERFTSADLVIPRYEGRRGHPVLLSRALLEEILALPVSSTAKEVVRAHLPGAAFLDVADPGVVQDIDTPEDYERLRYAGC